MRISRYSLRSYDPVEISCSFCQQVFDSQMAFVTFRGLSLYRGNKQKHFSKLPVMFQRIWMSFFNPKFALLPICTSNSKLIKYVTVNFLYFLFDMQKNSFKNQENQPPQMELFEKDIQMGRLQVYCTRGLRPEVCSENVIN